MTTSTNADGQVAVDHVLLYFNYSTVGKFWIIIYYFYHYLIF